MDMRIRIISSLICMMIANIMFGQNLSLHKGSKSKKFEIEDKIRVGYKKDKEACDRWIYFGKLLNVQKDSFSLKLKKEIRLTKTELQGTETIIRYIEPEIVSLSKDHVYFLQKEDNGKRKTVRALGGVLILTGIGSGVSSLFVDKDDRKPVLIAAGTQLLTGVLMNVLARRSKAVSTASSHDDPWVFD